MNMLTEKCWKVRVKCWVDGQGSRPSGYQVHQELTVSGFELIGMLAFNPDSDETKLEIVNENPRGATVEYMLERAQVALDRVKDMYGVRRSG